MVGPLRVLLVTTDGKGAPTQWPIHSLLCISLVGWHWELEDMEVQHTLGPALQKSACPQSCSFRLHQALDQHTAVRQIPPHENRLPELVLRDNVEIVRKHACQASFEDKSCYC